MGFVQVICTFRRVQPDALELRFRWANSARIASPTFGGRTCKENQSWMHRVEHFDQERHEKELPDVTEGWRENPSRRGEGNRLCGLPSYITGDVASSLWKGEVTLAEAQQEGHAWRSQ